VNTTEIQSYLEFPDIQTLKTIAESIHCGQSMGMKANFSH